MTNNERAVLKRIHDCIENLYDLTPLNPANAARKQMLAALFADVARPLMSALHEIATGERGEAEEDIGRAEFIILKRYDEIKAIK